MCDRIVLTTCRAWPELSPSDRCLADALDQRGFQVESAPWNGPFEPFDGARAVVIRSTWDYHQTLDDYRAWLDRLEPTQVFNAPDLVRWNLDKAYLTDLAARGAPLPACTAGCRTCGCRPSLQPRPRRYGRHGQPPTPGPSTAQSAMLTIPIGAAIVPVGKTSLASCMASLL